MEDKFNPSYSSPSPLIYSAIIQSYYYATSSRNSCLIAEFWMASKFGYIIPQNLLRIDKQAFWNKLHSKNAFASEKMGQSYMCNSN